MVTRDGIATAANLRPDLAASVFGASSDDPRVQSIFRALYSVTDPEIPVLTIIDMGIVAAIRINDSAAQSKQSALEIDITPTFVGCPAVEVIRRDIVVALYEVGEREVSVNVVFNPPWTSDRMTPEGNRKLKEFGVAPPSEKCGQHSLSPLDQITCPFCQSNDTDLESIFGPTLCRSIHYCRSCRQSFEHFKPVG